MKKLLIIILTLLTIAITVDILLRYFYCNDINLNFDSQEFNNIASPLISFFGFIGLIITVKITLNQFKLQQSSSYFDYYRGIVNKILQENNGSNNTVELLNFVFYSEDKYDKLKKYPSYLRDLESYKKGEIVTSNGKDYKNILDSVRLFRTELEILLKRYELLIVEIRDHEELSISHKDLLFKELFTNQITDYTVGLELLDQELREVKENLFIAFAHHSKDMLPFYDSSFYELKDLVEKDIWLKKYLNNNAL